MIYQEYPKAVKGKDGQDVLVRDAAEEAKIAGKSESAVTAQAAKNTEAGQELVDASVDKEMDRIREKGGAITEADLVKLTGEAQELLQKRGPGRPPKTGG